MVVVVSEVSGYNLTFAGVFDFQNLNYPRTEKRGSFVGYRIPMARTWAMRNRLETPGAKP